ncbi:hypothetical protein TSAR_014961 [Trichomalopsis sarcophagae]|uniref:Uncharacterized protein n=1 Tax=Trichomalopsis sarcophagae TaxID=543379 RepID=A0A232F569_9HYME|nr:hypothetical protein TSAR_014961 [Trichomalopsis sarcophagae]
MLQSEILNFNGDVVPVKTLLEHDDSEINACNSDGKTSLHTAVQNRACSAELIKLLMEHGADIKITTPKDGNTALHLLAMSCKVGHLAIGVTEILLDHESDVNAVNSIKGETPLHLIVQNEICSTPEVMIKFLLEFGADVKATTEDGNTPLHCTALGCKDERIAMRVIKMLLDYGSDINAVNFKGETSLHLILRNKVRSPELIKLLLERGADINAKTREDGNTALHMVLLDNEWDLFVYLDILLKFGCDVNVVDAMGNTPLHLSVKDEYSITLYTQPSSYNITLIRLILAYGADASIKNAIGETALQAYYRVMEDHKVEVDPLMRILLVPANERQEHKITQLHVACLFHRFELVRKMLNLGAYVNVTDSYGNSPLYYAIIITGDDEKYRTMSLMLDYGAVIITGSTCASMHRALELDCIREPNDYEDPPFVKFVLPYLAKVATLNEKLIKGEISGVIPREQPNNYVHVFQSIANNYEEQYKELRSYCSHQVRAMRQTNIGDTKVSFLDLLLADEKMLKIYAKNKELVRVFKERKILFPTYEGLMEAKIGRYLERRKLVEKAAVVLSDILRFADPSDVAFEMTLSHLSNQDLVNIIDEKDEVDILQHYEVYDKSKIRLFY